MAENDISFSGTVQETMLGPLWARAKYSQLYPEVLNDVKAIEIIKDIKYDFTKIEEYLEDWRGLGLLIRAKGFDDALKKYITKHPNATVVNVGAGLDTTFYRVDNGKIKWYDMDLPDAITFRKNFLPESSRNTYISKSALDVSWFEDIDFNPEKGIFFMVAGFIYYFKEEDISSLFEAMANRFPGGKLVFDCVSKMAVKIANRRAKKTGAKGPFWQLAIGNPMKQISKWSKKIQVIDWFTMWSRTERNPNWNKKTLRMISITERLKTSKIVYVKFLE